MTHDLERPTPAAAPDGTAGDDAGDAGDAPPSRHGPIAQLLISWSPLSAVLIGYLAARWVTAPLVDGAATNRWGSALHVRGPADADRWLFGVVPTVWLQQHLLGDDPGLLDALAALVYVTHFVTLPLLTAFIWFRQRERFRSWIAAVLTLTGTGYLGYVLYPAAPPWLAADDGVIGPVERTSHLGWEYLHLDVVGRLTTAGQDGSNPVAAMPSLHAGVALLVALYLWPAVGSLGRVLMVGYALAMAVVLVYTGEHYVVDVAVGWVLAILAAAVGLAVGRRRRLPPSRSRT